MGGSTGLGLCPGAWPKAVVASASNPDKTTKAIADNSDLNFLFIEYSFSGYFFFEWAHNNTVRF
jgi:hypothetical protein